VLPASAIYRVGVGVARKEILRRAAASCITTSYSFRLEASMAKRIVTPGRKIPKLNEQPGHYYRLKRYWEAGEYNEVFNENPNAGQPLQRGMAHLDCLVPAENHGPCPEN
jgi:hypothetical protein